MRHLKLTDYQPDHLHKTPGVGRILNKASGTIANWRSEKPYRGPTFIKIGGSCYYPHAELLAWIEKNTIREQPQTPETSTD